MTGGYDLVDALGFAAWLLLTSAAFRASRRRSFAAGRWLVAALGCASSAAGVVLVGSVAPERTQPALAALLVALVVSVPYLLYRFTGAFQPPHPKAQVAVGFSWLAATVFAAVAVLTAYRGTDPGPQPAWGLDIVWWASPPVTGSAVLGCSLLLTGWSVRRLWRAGRNQPGVTRGRMRLLAVGALMVAATITVGAAGSAVLGSARWLALAAGVVLVVGFAPPAPLREMWRAADRRASDDVRRALLDATTPAEVLGTFLPHAIRLAGGGGGAFIERSGAVLVDRGMSREQIETMAAAEEASRAPEVSLVPDGLILPLEAGTVVVRRSPQAPLLSGEELEVLASLGAAVDLAVRALVLAEQASEAQRRARWASGELDALVYGLSHDLRSPLISMLSYLSFIRADHVDRLTDEALLYLDRMRVNAAQMDAIIRDLLGLSRIGREPVQVEDVDVAAAARAVVEELRPQAPDAVFEIDALPCVRMGRERLCQLLRNLVENALLHGGRPDVTVRLAATHTAEGDVVLVVTDDGVGIPPTLRERVLGVFERAGAGGGTGVGLAICRRIAEEAGGGIRIAEAAVGTAVEVTLPASAALTCEHTLETAR